MITHYPAIQTVLNQYLAQDLTLFTQRIAKEQTRIQRLQRYLKFVPDDLPVIGHSKISLKLAQQIEGAAADLKPVILQAPAGSGKTFTAAAIHARSGLHHHPFAEVDCAQLPRDPSGQVQTQILWGDESGSLGLIELLERGTLLIDHAHLLAPPDRERVMTYVKTGRLPGQNPAADPVAAWVRLILAAPHPLAWAWFRDPAGSKATSAAASAATSAVTSADPSISQNPSILEDQKRPEFKINPKDVGESTRRSDPQPQREPTSPSDHHTIKLFTLSQRKADIPDFAQHFLDRYSLTHNRPPLQLDQADQRRLISYAYPGNLAELAGILERAVIMTPPGQTVIPEQVLWSVESAKNAFRVDLLNQIPWLRRVLLSDWWPERIWIGVMILFVPVVILGYWGPQQREANLTLNLFWAWWWPMYLSLFVVVGRIWCAVCPFMITGEWIRKLSLWIWPRQLQPWPTRWLNRWGAWILFGGFVAIYLWEKLWDLPHTPYLSSWLLLVITAGAVIGSLIYERRVWCRYLCPIGGMNGMFAKLSMIELRSVQQVCGSQCSSFGCYKGSDRVLPQFADPLPTEGQATGGCPLYSHPAQLKDNRDCVLCMTCLKACPNRSVELNVRFPATDLLEDHQGFAAEAALLLLLLGGVLMHHDHQILNGLGWPDLVIDADHFWISAPIVLILLAIPAVLTYAIHRLTRMMDPDLPDYPTVIYAYLPLTLAANLAYYTPAALTEAGQILPVIARTLGGSGTFLPTLTWSADVAAFVQEIVLLSAFLFSFYPLQRITQRSWWRNLPHLALMLGLTIVFGVLMLGSGS